MRQIVVRRAVKRDCWQYVVDGHTLIEPFDDKWKAYDDARDKYPQAMIKIEGIGIINGGSTITTEDGAREVSGVGGEATSAS